MQAEVGCFILVLLIIIEDIESEVVSVSFEFNLYVDISFQRDQSHDCVNKLGIPTLVY